MVYWELDFAGGIYQKCELTYNEDNNVIQEIGYDQDFSGVFQNSWKIDYEYDNQVPNIPYCHCHHKNNNMCHPIQKNHQNYYN